MVVTVVWIVNVRINASLKDIPEVGWLGGTTTNGLVKEHVKKRWDVSNVEETFMTQVNWLLVKHGFWNHLYGNGIPSGPKDFPFVDRGDVAISAI
jgi:hypothetical protein